MTTGKKDVEKRLRELKQVIAVLEAKCKDGSGTKEDYIELTKLKRRL